MKYKIFDPIMTGKRIQLERKALGYSQEKLAEELKYQTRQPIAKMENGEGSYNIEEMLKMCEIFKCDLGYLLCEYDSRTRGATDIHAVTGLSEEAINTLISWTDAPPNISEYYYAITALINEIIPAIPISLAAKYIKLQEIRRSLEPVPITEQEIIEMIIDIDSVVDKYPGFCILNHATAAKYLASEIAKEIEKILREGLEKYG